MTWEIDERKLRQAIPPTSTAAEDLKWSSAFIGNAALIIGLILAAGWLLLRALS